LNHNPTGSLYEGKVIVDKTYGHAAYTCMICCGPKVPWMVYDPLSVLVNGWDNQQINAVDSCGGGTFDVTDDFPTWWTANTSIATASNKRITGVAVGTTRHYAQSIDMYWGLKTDNPDGCPLSQKVPSAPTNVAPQITSISPSTGTIGKTLPVVITGTGFGTSPTVQTGPGIAATVTSANDTRINASFAIAPNASVGSYGVTVTVKAPDGTSLPSNNINFTLIAVAIPTNWTILSEAPLNSGALFFQYTWSSSTGNKADLSGCSVNETVFYPNFPTTPFIWPLPMVASPPTPNPTSPLPNGKGSDALAQDTNFPPDSYQQPYFTANFTAMQRWWWSCPYYNNGSINNFVPDLPIIRKIFKDTDGFWKYQITKSGYTNTVKLPNQ
jgi:hypothetical protein